MIPIAIFRVLLEVGNSMRLSLNQIRLLNAAILMPQDFLIVDS